MDADFGIRTYFTIFGLEITQTIIVTWAIMLILIVLALITKFRLKKVPDTFQLIMEFVIEGVHWLVDSTMGKNQRVFAPYILALTLYLLLGNLTGIIGVRQPTADLNTTFALALITFVMVHYHGVKAKGGLGYVKTFFEPLAFMFPMNIVSELALPVSLSFRLFGNMLGGVVILFLMYEFAPIIVPAIGHLYFDLFIGLIQTFIFVMLTLTFIALSKD